MAMLGRTITYRIVSSKASEVCRELRSEWRARPGRSCLFVGAILSESAPS